MAHLHHELAKKALLFDFDYTLVDSSEAIDHCLNIVLDKMHIPPATPEQVKSIMADTLEVAYFKLTGDENPEKAIEYANNIRDVQASLKDFKTHFFAGVHDELENLHAQGVKLGIVSSNDKVNIERFLKQEDALGLFDTIISATEVNAYKPHPQGLYKALKLMSLKQPEVIFLGDSLHDAGAAHNANVDFMGVLTGHATRDCFASLPSVGIHDDVLSAISNIKQEYL